MTKERPILFSAPMVRALLAGTKTQTRRVVKPPRSYRWLDMEAGTMVNSGGHKMHRSDLAVPYGQPGDRLWVREAWAHDAADLEQCRSAHEELIGGLTYGPYYRATESAPETLRWRPSIHMPRWASRITLEVTEVRVERAQDISEADAMAEGIVAVADGYGLPDGSHFHAADPRVSYWSLLDDINGPDFVESNPWIWAVSFKVVKGGAP